MTKKLTSTLIASMVGATVLTPVAFGQTAVELAAQNQNCLALEALIEEQSDTLRQEWIDETLLIVDAGVEAECLVYYEEAVVALDGTAVDAEVAARIVVTQADPDVDVQQFAPLVSVTQQEPRVMIDQGQPQIIVRQTPPNIRVQMPQPIITIDQPQPEIIVRMPDPSVAITNPEPQVEVRMPEPEVDVTQPEPQVSVQADQAAQTLSDGSNVSVSQQQPQVEITGTGNRAQFDVQGEEPTVLYEAAEPQIQIEEQGEPEIRYNQTGTPQIRFEDAGDGAAMQSDAMMGDADMDVANQMLLEIEPMEAGDPLEYNVGDLSDRALTNARGEELGTVDRIVLASDGREYVVLDEGGFLGFGEREVAIPLDSISVVSGALVMRGMTEDDIEAMPEFDSAGAQPLGDTDLVMIGTP